MARVEPQKTNQTFNGSRAKDSDMTVSITASGITRLGFRDI